MRCKTTLAIIVLPLVVALGGCGGDSGGSDEPRSASNGGSESTPQGETTARSDTPVVLKARLAKATAKGLVYRRNLNAKAGDSVVMVIEVTNAAKAKGTRVSVRLDKGPGNRLEIAGGNEGADLKALASLSGTDLQLGSLKYRCIVGGGTFCPVDAKATDDGYELSFDTPEGKIPLVLTTTVAGEKT